MEKDDEKRTGLEADGIFGKELNKQDSGAMRLEQLLDARSCLEASFCSIGQRFPNDSSGNNLSPF